MKLYIYRLSRLLINIVHLSTLDILFIIKHILLLEITKRLQGWGNYRAVDTTHLHFRNMSLQHDEIVDVTFFYVYVSLLQAISHGPITRIMTLINCITSFA